jgi:hypothetical protein
VYYLIIEGIRQRSRLELRGSVERGATSQIWLAAAADVVGGAHYADCQEEVLAQFAIKDSAVERLWRASEEILGVKSRTEQVPRDCCVVNDC